MGKKIDRIALLILMATAFYLFFLNAWHSIPLAAVVAFVCCILLKMLIDKRPSRYHCTPAQAETELLRIACLPEADAVEALNPLILYKYPDADYKLAPILKHPSASVSTGDVFALWKANREVLRMTIAATCITDARALTYAQTLDQPRVAIVDRRQFIRIIRESNLRNASVRTPRPRLRHVLENLTSRYIGPKNALFAFVLLGIYLLLGNPLYLFLSLGILFLFGVSLFGARGKKRLF